MCIYGPSFNLLIKRSVLYVKSYRLLLYLKKKSKQKEKKSREKTDLFWLSVIMLTCYLYPSALRMAKQGGGSYFFLKVQRDGGTFVEGLFKKLFSILRKVF